MRLRTIFLLAATLVAGTWVPRLDAGYCGVDGAIASRCCRQSCLRPGVRSCRDNCQPCGSCDYQCYTVMKTMTRTVYDNITDTQQKVVFDTVYDRQVVQDVRQVSEICYRQEQFTYQRPVYETVTNEVPYTVNRPVCETRTREVSFVRHLPSYETRTKSVPYTVWQTVYETGVRTVNYAVPRQECYTVTVPITTGRWETHYMELPRPCAPGMPGMPGYPPGAQKDGVSQKGDPGCDTIKICKRVWVPCIQYKEVTCARTVYDQRSIEVPYTECRTVPETRTRDVQYTVCRMMPVTETRTVEYQVMRMVPEQRFRTVSQTVTRMVSEVGTRSVPQSITREVPITREVTVPRQVPRTVLVTTTRCVPRTECFQVPVRICVPVPAGGPCQDGKGKGKADTDLDRGTYGPAPPDPQPAQPLDGPVDAALRRLSSTSERETPVYHSVSHKEAAEGRDAAQLWAAGIELYRNGRFGEAAGRFLAAVEADSSNAKYAYFHAAALHRVGQQLEASEALARALQAEQRAPIANWGRTMERIQGSTRVWLEQNRSAVPAQLAASN